MLSANKVKSIKPGDKEATFSDGQGLNLKVYPGGTKSWVFFFRLKGVRSRLSHTIGEYPAMSLADARVEVSRLRILVAEGKDPRKSAAEIELEESGTVTFKGAATSWFDSQRGARSPDYEATIWYRLDTHVFPDLADLTMTKIRPRQILACVQKLEERGNFDLSKRCLWLISTVFSYSMVQDWAHHNPAMGLEKAMKKSPRAKSHAALKPADLPEFFQRLAGYDGSEMTTVALEFVMHTFVRTKEARFARWSEMEIRATNPTWRIPGERMKMDREHLVPLTPRSIELLDLAKSLGGGSDLVFPGERGVMSENTMLYALYRLGYRGQATVHGMRGLASTVLNETGLFQPDWVEKQLAHDEKDAVRAAYNSAEYLTQRREMMAWYSDFLERHKKIGDLLG